MFLWSRLAYRKPEVLATLIIFSLASGVVGGTFFFIDSIGPEVFQDLTQDVGVHMEIAFTDSFYRQDNFTLEEAIEIANNQTSIDFTEAVVRVETYSYPDYNRLITIGVNSSFFQKYGSAIELIHGDYTELTNETCFISQYLASIREYEIGDTYNISLEYWYEGETEYEWREITQPYTIVGIFDSEMYMEYDYRDDYEYSALSVITTWEGLVDRFEEVGFSQYDGLDLRIWAQFDADILLGGGVSDIATELGDTQRRIEQKGLPYLVVYRFDLYYSIYDYSAWSIGMLSVALTISIPAILMGFMLIQYNSKLQADEDRRDVGTVKTRGASGLQAFRWILGNALVIGILGSLGALLAGFLTSLVSGGVTGLLEYNLHLLLNFQVILRPNAILLVFTYSFGIGMIVSLPQAINAFLMTPIEAHTSLERDILLEKEQLGGYYKELVGLAISIYFLPYIMLIFAFSSYISYISLSIFTIVAPLFAILIFSVTRLCSRPTSSIKTKILTRMKRPSLVVGTRLLGRVAGLYKKSEAMGVLFISLVFAAGTLSSVAATSGTAHVEDLLYFEKGADIIVHANPDLHNVTLDMLDNITRVEGVSGVSAMYTVRGRASYISERRTVTSWVQIVGVQPDQWLETAFWLPYFTLHGTPENAVQSLSTSNSNVLSSFRPLVTYQPGFLGQLIPIFSNQMMLGIDTFNDTIWNNCTITDVVSNSDMSYGPTYIAGYSRQSSTVVVNLEYIHNILNTTEVDSFYVKITDGANVTKLIEDIEAVAPFSFSNVESPLPTIDSVFSSRMGQALLGTYSLNILYALIYLSIGFSIVSAIKGRNLRKQYSILRALGSGRQSIIVPVLVDALITIILAGIIGIILGVLLAYFLSAIPLFFIGNVTTLFWADLPVRIITPTLLFIGLVGFTMFFGLLSSYVVSRRILSRNIAEEIQYSE